MRRVFHWLFRLVEIAVVALVTIIVGRAFQARTLPDLKPWHRAILPAEANAAALEGATFAEYLRREDEIFSELGKKVGGLVSPEDRTTGNRYFDGSPVNPTKFPVNYNRTFELVPDEPAGLKGGVLLVHGLSDGPYSMRPLARIFRDQGFYALALRMQGHGAIPGGLVDAKWPDWMAAVRIGARHVRERIGKDKPFFLVGYSNGGALVVKYSLDALSDATLPAADRVVLMSPMIGVTPFAAISKIASALSMIPYFEKSRWLDVIPEYNPYKFNSFPMNAAEQTFDLTRALQKQILAAEKAGNIARLPPILTFQSLVDATVSTDDIVTRFYDHLDANGSELVLFDMNRRSDLGPFVPPQHQRLLAHLMGQGKRRYTLTALTNVRPDTSDVAERTIPAGATEKRERPLGLAWPREVFSLSHIAIPFPVSDPLFGSEPDMSENFGARLGLIGPRGEKSVLSVPLEQWMRISFNPFFPYMEARVKEWIAAGSKRPLN